MTDGIRSGVTPWRYVKYWLPPVAYAGLIFYLSSLSHPETLVPGLLTGFNDKVIHAGEYGVLGILCYRALRFGAGITARSALLLAIGTATLYGCTDELHQAFVPLREADGWDIAADLMGSAIAASGWAWLTGLHAASKGRTGEQSQIYHA